MVTNSQSRLLEHATRVGVLRSRDLRGLGIHRRILADLVDNGQLVRVARGLYRLADAPLTENHTLAEVATLIPKGVVCLLSALRFHGLTTELPSEIWVAVAPKAWKPQITHPNVHIVRFSERSLNAGVESRLIEGVPVRVFGAAKTVADCFKFRNKIGTNVAVEALRDGWRTKLFTAEELWRYAKLCRVDRIMRPYLESFL